MSKTKEALLTALILNLMLLGIILFGWVLILVPHPELIILPSPFVGVLIAVFYDGYKEERKNL